MECMIEDRGEYNLETRIGSVFAVLLASACAVFLPVFIQKAVTSGTFKSDHADYVMVIVKQFGAGVIVATAFIHLLPDAFEAFASPCIGELKYDAWPGAIAMIGVLATFLIENVGHRVVSDRIKKAKAEVVKQPESEPLIASGSDDDNDVVLRVVGHSHHHVGDGHAHFHGDGHPETHNHTHGHAFFEIESGQDDELSAEMTNSIDRLSLYVLESGIAFHSILIGLTLSVTRESTFKSLFVVVVFHQVFEGMALGTRIIDVSSLSVAKRYTLCTYFCLITPIGMVIGILVRSNYAGDSSPVALWAIGTLNSLSAGILLWVSLVELLAEEWIHGELHESSTTLALLGLSAIGFGAMLMSLLGNWV
ncbi:Zinc/iron permease, partial [Lipomyces arxii]|uniref:Zinc/iron permease n=1 Tax=Lipomyces arxii TaxID=56418 RepID=UPI0034CEF73B